MVVGQTVGRQELRKQVGCFFEVSVFDKVVAGSNDAKVPKRLLRGRSASEKKCS